MKVGKSNTKSKKKGERQMKKYIKNKCNENQVKENKCFNYNNGITLVALVVTIVVLLILAGVTINLVVGKNGLIARAKEASEKTEEAKASENISFNEVTDYIKQTVGVSASGITKDDYGKVVTNYNADGKTWEIFYADDSNVYLITKEVTENQSLIINAYNGTDDSNENINDLADENVVNSKYPAIAKGLLAGVYDANTKEVKYKSSYENMRATLYLLDSDIWNATYKTGDKVDFAIGAPTVELLGKSYGKYEGENIIIDSPIGKGYAQTIINGLAKNKANGLYNNGNDYWLACPSNGSDISMRVIYSNGQQVNSAYYTSNYGIRPIVCLKSEVILVASEDNKVYTIK